MNIFQAAFLGLLQGLTEFLPISSSGHLVIAQSFLPNFSQPGVMFDVLLHFGTAFSVIFYFRKKLKSIKKDYLVLLAIGTLPAFFFGYLFSDTLEKLFESTKLVGIALILTSLMNYFIDKHSPKLKKVTSSNSIFIGFAQALAIIPGISRSSSTIFAGSLLSIKKAVAAEFSFLLSVPTILGASIYQVYKYGLPNELFGINYLVGFLLAFVFGLIAINFVFSSLKKKRFKFFAIYCFAVGVLALYI